MLIAIARKLERKGQYSPTERIQLAVGLPPEHYGSLKEKFAAMVPHRHCLSLTSPH